MRGHQLVADQFVLRLAVLPSRLQRRATLQALWRLKAAVRLPPPKNLDDPAVAFTHFGDCQQWIQVERRPRPVPPGWDDLILDINIIKARRYLPKERPPFNRRQRLGR